MTQNVNKALEYGAVALTGVTGVSASSLSWFGFLNNNAPGIGILLTAFFGLIAVCFQIYNTRKIQSAEDNKREIEKLRREIRRIDDRKKRELDNG